MWAAIMLIFCRSEAGSEVGSARCLMKPLTTARRRAGGGGVISCSQAVPFQCRPLSGTATRQAATEQSAHAIAIVSAGRYRYVTAAVAVMTTAAGKPGKGGDRSRRGSIAFVPNKAC